MHGLSIGRNLMLPQRQRQLQHEQFLKHKTAPRGITDLKGMRQMNTAQGFLDAQQLVLFAERLGERLMNLRFARLEC